MKQIDDICAFYINASIGPVVNLKRYIQNRAYLRERGYKIEVFSRDFVITEKTNKSVDFTPGLEVRNKIKVSIKQSKFLSILFIIHSMFAASRCIKKYLSLKRSPDIVIFHDVIYCYQYLKMAKTFAKTRLFFEMDGTLDSIYLEAYPKLENSRFLKYLYKRLDYVYQHVDRYIFVAKNGLDNFFYRKPFFR